MIHNFVGKFHNRDESKNSSTINRYVQYDSCVQYMVYTSRQILENYNNILIFSFLPSQSWHFIWLKLFINNFKWFTNLILYVYVYIRVIDWILEISKTSSLKIHNYTYFIRAFPKWENTISNSSAHVGYPARTFHKIINIT